MIQPSKTYCPNILTVSGTGRKVGKTYLACSLIERLPADNKATGIKISPHFHDVDYKVSIAEKPGAFAIYEEDRTDRGKDSSDMLAAGAGRVYYIQTRDEHLREAWKILSGLLKGDTPVIIESGRIHDHMIPGMSLLLTRPEMYDQTLKSEKAKIPTHFTEVISDIENLEPLLGRIYYSDGNWKLHEKHD